MESGDGVRVAADFLRRRRLSNLQRAAAYTIMALAPQGSEHDCALQGDWAASLAAALDEVNGRGRSRVPTAMDLILMLTTYCGAPLAELEAQCAGRWVAPPRIAPPAPWPLQ